MKFVEHVRIKMIVPVAVRKSYANANQATLSASSF